MRKENLIGFSFARLTVIGESVRKIDARGTSRVFWPCKCSCGNTFHASTSGLKRGHNKSCGCLARETSARIHTTHGGARRLVPHDRAYNIWAHMLQRCTNPKNADYKDYGGRGITVCDRWLQYANFIQDMGQVPEKYSIDRIDNDMGYSLENCRWADGKTQARNSRKNRIITFDGKTMVASEWAELLKIPYKTFMNRIYIGWDIDKVITQPLRS